MKIKEAAIEKVEQATEFVLDHPTATTIASNIVCLVVSIPLCIACYKYLGGVAGKEAAKEFARFTSN